MSDEERDYYKPLIDFYMVLYEWGLEEQIKESQNNHQSESALLKKSRKYRRASEKPLKVRITYESSEVNRPDSEQSS